MVFGVKRTISTNIINIDTQIILRSYNSDNSQKNNSDKQNKNNNNNKQNNSDRTEE